MQTCAVVDRPEHRAEFPAPPPELKSLSVVSAARTLSIETLNIKSLRAAIRANLVTFPAQVPVFEKHDRPDLQRKVVQLYFLLGWSTYRIAARYNIASQRVTQVINTWKQRAQQMGYVQEIPREHSPVKPVAMLPIQVVLTQIVEARHTRLVMPPLDSPTAKDIVADSPAQQSKSGLKVKQREAITAGNEADQDQFTLAGGDEVTLLRNENRLLKKLLAGLMVNEGAGSVGALVGK